MSMDREPKEAVERWLAGMPPNVRHTRLLIDLGPRITDAFKGPGAAGLLEPAVAVFLDQDPPAIALMERVELSPLLDAERKCIAEHPESEGHVLVVVDDGAELSARAVLDPRVDPDWYERLKEAL